VPHVSRFLRDVGIDSNFLRGISRDERVLRPDTGHGFLWWLYSYLRFGELEAGAIVECRAIPLTRERAIWLGWAIEPIIKKLPKKWLINTLKLLARRCIPQQDSPS
jgi:hypothetical protein